MGTSGRQTIRMGATEQASTVSAILLLPTTRQGRPRARLTR